MQAIVRIYDPKGKDFDKAEAAVNKLFKDSMLKLRDFRSSFDALFEQNKKNVLETGSSSLYMCFGVLRWHAPDEKVAHYAPLILEPIDIEKRGTSQFVVKLRERDEIRFNGTLIQLMKEKFNIDLSELDPVPCDDSGADVAGVFETIRRKLSALDECCGWEVLEICAAADLKFDNFEIWHDLHTLGNEQLLKTPIVDAMTAGDSRFHQNWDDDAIAKTQVAAVFPYDDAQRKAVQAAFSGLDFALIGGAGVGKTQAAANILANAIWKKKRTLVVAEEKEFLDQIKGMLDEVGLSDFTLSLYDADTKDEVWKRVAKSLERVENGRWDEETGFAQDLSGLNDVESELESRYKNLRTKKGDGLYDLLTLCDSVPSDSPLKLDPADVQKMSKFDVEKTFRADFNRLVECGQKTTPEQRTQFSQIRAAEISANLKELALDYQESLKLVKRFGRALAKQIGSIDGAFTEPRAKNDYFSLDAALAFYTDSKASGAVYSIFENAELTDALNEYYADAAKLRQALEILLDEWKSEEALLAIRVDECAREYEHSAAKKLFTSSRKALADKLNALRKKPLSFESIPSRLRQVEAYQRGVKRLEERLAALPESCKTALERWSGRDEFDAARKEFQQFHELAESDPRKSAIGKALRENPNIQRYAVEYRGAYARFSETSRKFNAAIKRETPVCEDWIAEESDFCGFIAQNVDKLKGWAAYASAREECVKKGMRALVEEYERSYNASGLYDRFRKGFYQAAIDSIVSRPYWAKFSRERYEERLSSYRELFGKYLRSTAKEIAKRHAKDFIASKNSDQIKTEEFKFRQLERRECTIRELVRTTPHLLFALCPCVLATPQDVAACFSDYQGSGVFDLAIIGNADTLPAVKSLGAIARSKHTIAAADPVLTEKRSLYDAFSNVCTDKLRLTRHYRSKNGALIAYSNKNTYEGKLAAAPAFYDPNPRVKAVCVDGSDYDEAAAVCAELLRRYNDKGLRKQTAAIVAFSEKQWTLLDSLLNKLKERDPRFEAWVDKFTALQRLDKELHDHEVDAMLISTGNLDTSVNYLKTKGAERWFAYAATRAKESIVIFSTNESRDIRPNGTESAGLAALYHFMVYAETGRLNCISFDEEKKRVPEGVLACDVCRTVQEAGFDYELQVGPNALAVDVAVVDKELRGRGYVLGILFDDVNLKTWRENRQRCEFLQNAGWKRLYRVYARDYYNNRVETIAALKEFLTQVKAELEEEKSAPKGSEPDNKLFEDVKRLWREIKKDDDFIAEIEELDKEEGGVEEDYDEDAFEEETAQAFNAPNDVDEEAEEDEEGADDESEDDEEEGFDDDSESYESEEDEDSVLPSSEPSSASGSSGSALYPNAPIELAAFELPITETTAEDYVLRANRDAIVERIERLVAASAPIRKDALLQEIHRSFGIKRASGAVVGATNRALKAANVVVKVEKSIVLPKTKDGSVGKREKVEYCWRMDQDPKRYADIRVSNSRKIDFVCLQEARNAMCLVLIKKGPMKKQDLVKETYNLLGFKRGGKLVVEALEFVFDQIKGKDIKAVKKGRDPEYAFIGEA